MSDLGKLDLGDWLGLAVVSVGAGVSSAMAWFSKSNAKRDERTDELECRMSEYETIRNMQSTKLAVIESCQKNIEEKLDDLKDEIKRSAERGAHSVNEQIAYVVSEVQKIVTKDTRNKRHIQIDE